MFSFLVRCLRAMTPTTTPDWLADHPDAERVDFPREERRFTFRDHRTNEQAVYETDALGNVRRVEVGEA